MLIDFFTPENKVHKQRNLMRDTDFRMVRYSRRGLALSLAIFLLAMYLGEYYERQPKFTMILFVGLVVSTVIRGFYLYRFDHVYPRAPARWRNIYFFITILSGAWWGLILSAITFEIGLAYETPLLWFYTVAFFSSCSHVFSPFQKFYRTYIFITLLPCSIVALTAFQPVDALYGVVMIVLLFFLQRQGEEQGISYWNRLQANYDLTQKANALEAEKIHSESSLNNRETLFSNFAGELKTSLKEIIGSLQLLRLAKLPEQEEQLVQLAEQKSQQQMHMLQNILEFSHISKKDIRLDVDVIDLRAVLEKSLSSISDQIYKNNIEVFSRFSPEFPLRVRADAQRLQQIVVNMVLGALDYANGGSLLMEVNYTGSSDVAGTIKVSFKLESPLRSPEIEQELHDAFRPHYAANIIQGLQLAIGKGLAGCMQGSAGTHYTKDDELVFWFTAAIPVVTPYSNTSINMVKLNGKRLLLFQPPKSIEDEYKNALESWGLVVDIFYDQFSALESIEQANAGGQPFDLIMIYTHIDNIDGVEFSTKVAEKTENKTPQIVCLTESQSKLPVVEELIERFPQVDLLKKPIVYKQLRQRFKYLLTDEGVPSESTMVEEDFLYNKKVLLLQKEEIDRTIAEVMLKKLGCEVTSVDNGDDFQIELRNTPFDAVILDNQIGDVDMKEFIQQAVESSQERHGNCYIPPILGLSQSANEGDETRCLQSGMNYFIDSPLQIDDLRAILRRWIGRSVHMAQQRRDEQNASASQ